LQHATISSQPIGLSTQESKDETAAVSTGAPV
jgi:hypothetical protein